MVYLDRKGVSDIIVIAFMFLFLAVAVALLFGYSVNPLRAANERRKEFQIDSLEGVLRNVEPVPGIDVLEASAEQLVLGEDARVDNDELKQFLDERFDFLAPPGRRIYLEMEWGDERWSIGERLEEGIRADGAISMVGAGGEITEVDYEIWLFENGN